MSPLPLMAGRNNPVSATGAMLRYASFPRADLSHMVFDGSDLRGSDMTGAKVWRASFKDCKLQQVRGLEMDVTAA
jgi:uncharacterized protein YjbI with pentapeptide repeats